LQQVCVKSRPPQWKADSDIDLRSLWTVLALLFTAVSSYTAVPVPQAENQEDTVRVFLDCPSCDEQYVRTEITFVSYVRDRAVADVHVLVTTESTGGGGTEYSLKFIGLGRYRDVDNSLTYTAPQTATPDERRRGLASMLKLGLVRYVANTRVASRLKLEFDEPSGKIPPAPQADPWNFWVFRVGGNGSVEAEQATNMTAVSGSVSTNRTTADLKVNLNGFVNYRQQHFDLDEDEDYTAVRKSFDGRALIAKTLTSHWSAGATAAIGASTFTNYDLRSRFAPAVEYDIYPYSESTRRILTLLYSVGLISADYTEETIYGKVSEGLVDHQFEVSLGLRQPWGTANGGFEAAQYLNRHGKYRISAFGGMNVRLFKGFSVTLDGSVSKRRDQLSLRRGEATSEEILVRQRELATDYAFDLGFGITYSFGSIFNNVVNPRFRNAGGF
jgi:hypothetical protein